MVLKSLLISWAFVGFSVFAGVTAPKVDSRLVEKQIPCALSVLSFRWNFTFGPKEDLALSLEKWKKQGLPNEVVARLQKVIESKPNLVRVTGRTDVVRFLSEWALQVDQMHAAARIAAEQAGKPTKIQISILPLAFLTTAEILFPGVWSKDIVGTFLSVFLTIHAVDPIFTGTRIVKSFWKRFVQRVYLVSAVTTLPVAVYSVLMQDWSHIPYLVQYLSFSAMLTIIRSLDEREPAPVNPTLVDTTVYPVPSFARELQHSAQGGGPEKVEHKLFTYRLPSPQGVYVQEVDFLLVPGKTAEEIELLFIQVTTPPSPL